MTIPSSPQPTGYVGPYRGVVTNNVDPEGLDRIKAVIPQLFGNTSTECDWALPSLPVGYPPNPPPPGQGVWLVFEGGDLNYPVWIGVWSTIETTPVTVASVPIGGSVDWWSDTLPVNSGAVWAFLHGQTITGGVALYPLLAAAYPAWVSGSDIVVPDTRDLTIVGAGGASEPGATGGAAHFTLTVSNIPQMTPSITSTFTGGAVTSTGQSADHNHNFPITNIVFEGASTVALNPTAGGGIQATGSLGLTTSGVSSGHNHNVTAAGTVASSSTAVGTASPASVSTIQPFIAAHKIVRVA